MNRIDRLMAILGRLQAKKQNTVEGLAKHFEISERTLFRDLKALGEIGVPIQFDKDKGYSVGEGYFLPPVSLTLEEVNALALMAPIVQRFADKSIQEHFDAAFDKIKIVLNPNQRKDLEQMQQQTAHYLPEIHAHMLPAETNLSTIQKTILYRQILRINYEKENGERSERIVEPIGLTFYSLNWHLIAWCQERSDYRDFRVNRITKLEETKMPFRKTDHLTLLEFLKDLEQEQYGN